jgi:hypothetical protein
VCCIAFWRGDGAGSGSVGAGGSGNGSARATGTLGIVEIVVYSIPWSCTG